MLLACVHSLSGTPSSAWLYSSISPRRTRRHIYLRSITRYSRVHFITRHCHARAQSPGHTTSELISLRPPTTHSWENKWLKYSPVNYENLRGLEDASDFNTCGKSWLEIVYIRSCHFDSIKPLKITLTRPQLGVKHYHMDLTQA